MQFVVGIVLLFLRFPGYWLWRRRQTFRAEATGPDGLEYRNGGFRLCIPKETYDHGIHMDIWLNEAELIQSYEKATGSGACDYPSLELIRQHLTEALLRQGYRKVYIQDWTPDWGA